MAETLNFSGHETFHCRPFWLKKGHDFLQQQRSFSDDSAVAYLGVGKNMVTAIRFWMKAFGMADDNQLTDLAKKLLADKGWDPYLEDLGSLWLLHYHLVKERHASIASIVFTELRDRVPEFTVKQYADYVISEIPRSNAKTLEKDFGVFVRNYRDKDEELDDLAGLLADLELVSMTKVDAEDEADRKARRVYYIERKRRATLPARILLYAILDSHPEGLSLSLTTMMDPVGQMFALDKEGMTELLTEVDKNYKGITFARNSGVYELQFKQRPDRWTILSDHYAQR